MNAFIKQAREYDHKHAKPISLYTHFVGIPFFLLAMFILLGIVHIVIPNFVDIRIADIVGIALLIYYFTLEWRVALAVTPIFFILLFLSSLFTAAGVSGLAVWGFIICFIIGAGSILVGHMLEGKRSLLSHDYWQSLLSPMFLTAKVLFMFGWLSSLQKKIEEPVAPTILADDDADIEE